MNYEAYNQGVRAKQDGASEDSNPYQRLSSDWCDWYEGYTDMEEAILRGCA